MLSPASALFLPSVVMPPKSPHPCATPNPAFHFHRILLNTVSSAVWGKPSLDPTELVDRRAMRFLSQGGAWNHVAMKQAIADSGLEESDISGNERTGIIMGSGGPSTRTIVEAADITLKNNSPKRIGPFAVPKAMSSTASATLATGSRSTASTIRSLRPAPHRRIASATPRR